LAVAARLTPDLEENLLKEILRVGTDVHDSQSEGVDERGVAVVEALEGLAIAARDLLDQKDRVVTRFGTHDCFLSQSARWEQGAAIVGFLAVALSRFLLSRRGHPPISSTSRTRLSDCRARPGR
jgi:hypothetical protein